MKKKFVLVCLILAFFIAACTQHKIASGINPVQESDLESTTAMILYDLYVEGDGLALTVESSDEINKIIQALDTQHEVTEKTFCAPRYRLQLLQQDGSIVEIDYFCDYIDPFIRSNLDYFENQDYAVTKEFVRVMDEILAQSNIYSELSSESLEDPTLELANPASEFCEEQGGTVEIREDETGGQYGVCVFEDGSECDEWAYFRGECEPGE